MALPFIPMLAGAALAGGTNFLEQLLQRRLQKRTERLQKAQAHAALEGARLQQRQAEEIEAERFPTQEGKTTPHGFGRHLSEMASRRVGMAQLSLKALREARRHRRRMRFLGPVLEGTRAAGTVLLGGL